jgi:hypothetical protein
LNFSIQNKAFVYVLSAALCSELSIRSFTKIFKEQNEEEEEELQKNSSFL